jgi:hypothetical protein
VLGIKFPELPSTCTGRLGILLSLAVLTFPPYAFSSEPQVPVKRSVLGLSLGMDERRFLRENDAVLVHDDSAAGHRAYVLNESPDHDVRRVTVSTFGSQVLKVDVEFSDGFVRNTRWFDLVWRYCAKYGPSRLAQIESPDGTVTDVVEWGDGKTQLVLRHVWRGRSDGTLQSGYFATYADAQYPLESHRVKRPAAAAPKDNAVE